MGKLRILQVNKFYGHVTGGVERVTQQVSEGLKDRADIRVLACKKKGRTETEVLNGVEVCQAGSLGVLFSMPLSISFFRHFRKMAASADLVQLHMPFPLGDLALLLSGYRGKVVLWWHSDIVRQKKLMPLYKPLMKWTLRRADAVIAATKGNLLGSKYLRPYAKKCVIIPYGVKPAEEAAPRQAGAETEFLFVGRLVYYKGVEVLLEAFAKTEASRLTLVGEGVLKDALEARAQALGIADRVQFKSGLSDEEVEEELRRCDVLVLPSVENSEAFGLVQIEAMAQGKPVINTWLPTGVPNVSRSGRTGLTTAPGNAEALAAAMRELAADPAERAEMGRAARERVRKKFSESRMLDRVFDLYRSLVKQGEEEQ